MKQSWRNFSMKIDGMSTRERIFVFAAALSVLLASLQVGLLEPLKTKQISLLQRIAEQNSKMAGIDAQILQKLRAFDVDPDLAARKRLRELMLEPQQLNDELRAMEEGLVVPGKMAPLLESILKANGQLQLVSMKSLARSTLFDMASAPDAGSASASGTAPAAGSTAPAALTGASEALAPNAASNAATNAATNAANLIYRHGIEITVQGPYLGLLAYLAALDAMPVKLYWGKAELVVTAYPLSRLTFTVYTLSLDQIWIKL